MNPREKRLLIATISVVAVWVLSLLLKSDPDVAHADAVANPNGATSASATSNSSSGSSAAASSTAAPKNNSSSNKSSSGNSSSASSNKSAPVPATAYRFRPEQLDSLVALRQSTGMFVPVSSDPFVTLKVRKREGVKKKIPDKRPELQGLYRAGGARGALLDGTVCFEGDKCGDKREFTLIKVTDDGIVLAFDGVELPPITYDPIRGYDADKARGPSRANQ